MRIAFIAPYQGTTLCQHRPITSNFGLGATAKMRILAELLRRSSHEVEIFSQGEVIESKLTYYPPLVEAASADEIPVRYASAVPLRGFNALWSTRSLLRLFKAHHRRQPYDLVVIYNLKPPQVTCADYALRHGLPVVMEYEDDQFLEIWEPNFSRFTSDVWEKQARQLLPRVSGCVAGSADLLAQVGEVPKLLLPGVIDRAIITEGAKSNGRRNWVVFSGTHSRYQGLASLITSWKQTPQPGWELHIAGHGEITSELHAQAAGDPTIVFHGVLDRDANAKLLTQGKISVVAYEVEKTRGFSFKTLECLGAGLHVITTRLTALSALDPELKTGLTYLDGNDPDTISACLTSVINDRRYEQTSRDEAIARYGPDAVQRSLNAFLLSICHSHAAQLGDARPALI